MADGALKAQAVAPAPSRSPGVGGNGFDLYADTRSQVYEGIESEYAIPMKPLKRPAARCSLYQGGIAETLFSACSGGHTESNRTSSEGPRSPTCRASPIPTTPTAHCTNGR